MQRLTGRRYGLDGERGSVSVMTALLMVVLLAFAAISVDVSAMYAERQQLQTGADAAALAVAQDCARKDCRVPATTAQALAAANKNDGEATASVTPVPTPASGQVTVETSGITEHWFAPVLGFDETAVAAAATAGWGAPVGGTAVLPLTFSLCEFNAQTGGGLPSSTTPRRIEFTKSSTTGCTGPSGNVVPGGFGWLAVDAGTCNTTSALAQTLWTSTGNAVPSGCTSANFSALQNATVLLPIFDQAGDSGSNAWYRIHGYAAFRITGYYFADSKYRWNSDCTGTERCVHGYFTQFVDLSDSFDYGPSAPDLGASVVSMLPDS